MHQSKEKKSKSKESIFLDDDDEIFDENEQMGELDRDGLCLSESPINQQTNSKKAPGRLGKRTKSSKNFRVMESSSEEEIEDKSAQNSLNLVIHRKLDSIHGLKRVGSQTSFFVKFKCYSHGKCEWRTEVELLRTERNLKTRLKRYHPDHGSKATPLRPIKIDADFKMVEKVISSSESAVVLHPKKSSEVKKSTRELMLRIVRFLTDFSFQNVDYGVFFMLFGRECNETMPDGSKPIDLSTVSNRLYMDYYTCDQQVWNDLETVFKSVEKYASHSQEKTEILTVSGRMKQVAKKLFEDWMHFVTNFERIKKDFLAHDLSFFESKTLKNTLDAIMEQDIRSDKWFADVILFVDQNETKLSKTVAGWDSSVEDIRSRIEAIQSAKEVDKTNGKEELQCDSFSSLGFDQDKSASEINIESVDDDIPVSDSEGVEDVVSEARSISIQNALDQQTLEVPEETEVRVIPKKDNKEPEMLDESSKSKLSANEKREKANTEFLLRDLKSLLCCKVNFIETVFSEAFYEKTDHSNASLVFLKDTDSSSLKWYVDHPKRLTLFENSDILYLVKWKKLSYTDCTWEREGDILSFADKIKEFKRFSKCPDVDVRRRYIQRFKAFVELQSTITSTRHNEKNQSQTVTDLVDKVFHHRKNTQNVVFTQKNQIVYKNHRLLKSYQLESLNWMVNAWSEKRNIILADEMGLGKTVQAMSFIHYLVSEEEIPGPYLVIAPLSTLHHWKHVFEEWTNLNSILYYDCKGKNGRLFCRKHEFHHREISAKGSEVTLDVCKFTVLITSPEVFAQDFESVFAKLPMQHIIFDEAHKLKNKNTKIVQQLKQYACKKVFLLTGTPIQNNLSELWSLLNFIEPSVFPDLNVFLTRYGTDMKMESIHNLQVTLRPYLLRRMKDSVEDSIPPLTETVIDIELTNLQKVVYKSLYEKSKGLLQKGNGISSVGSLSNLEMQLRKVCNHPFIIPEVKDNLTVDCHSDEDYFCKLLQCSGKMLFLDKAVNHQKMENKKILIFSQFTEVLRLLEEYFKMKNIRAYKIDGNTKPKDRQMQIDSFSHQKNNDFEVFLLSTKAGGVGINLISAKTVIIFDSDWNPQNDVQAIARAHRIGQTSEVKVFRLITKNTYEAEMYQRSSRKLALDQAMLFANKTDQKSNERVSKLNQEEIELLLKKGILGILEEKGQDGTAAEIDNVDLIINEKGTNVVGSYAISKKNFGSDNGEERIRIDDPDFWRKIFKDKKTKLDDLAKEIGDAVREDSEIPFDTQKRVFLALLAEGYKYLEERVKSDGFIPQLEDKLKKTLKMVRNSALFHMVLRRVADQFILSINKSFRRLTVVDEAKIDSLLAEFEENPEGHNDRPFEVSNSSVDEDSLLKKRGSIDDTGLTPRSKNNFKRPYCDYCSGPDDLLLCQSCGKSVHGDCFDQEPTIAQLEGEHNRTQSKSAFKCYFCANNIAKCFSCGEIDLIAKVNCQFSSTPSEIASSGLSKCAFCHKFYHKKCNAFVDAETVKCKRHFCMSCQECYPKLFDCVLCPNTFHYRCGLGKFTKMGRCKVVCWVHRHSKDKGRQKEKRGPESSSTGKEQGNLKGETDVNGIDKMQSEVF